MKRAALENGNEREKNLFPTAIRSHARSHVYYLRVCSRRVRSMGTHTRRQWESRGKDITAMTEREFSRLQIFIYLYIYAYCILYRCTRPLCTQAINNIGYTYMYKFIGDGRWKTVTNWRATNALVMYLSCSTMRFSDDPGKGTRRRRRKCRV